jgi:DNA-binding transcriptional regulator YbjK
MAEEVSSGLSNVVSGIFDSIGRNPDISTETLVDPEEIKREMEKFDKPTPSKKTPKKKDPESEPEEEEEVEEEEEEIVEDDEEESDEIETGEEETEPEDIKKGTKSKKVSDVDVEEEELVSAFADLFAEELGWEFDKKNKPKDIAGIVKYMQDVIEYNSAPKYSSDQIKELDEFVANGGDVKDFFSKVYTTEIDPEKVDLDNETDQKAIIEQNLLNKGYTKERIKKLISRYEDAGSLEDEATDSLAEVKEYTEKTKKQLLEEQKNEAEAQRKQQLKFVQDVDKLVKDTSSVMGYRLSEKDKQELLEGIFKTGKDGLTEYQRKYQSNLKNLLESAFFTLKGDVLEKNITKKATTSAVNSLKEKIRSKGKSTKNTASEIDDDGSKRKTSNVWDVLGSQLLKK